MVSCDVCGGVRGLVKACACSLALDSVSVLLCVGLRCVVFLSLTAGGGAAGEEYLNERATSMSSLTMA